MKTYRIHAPFYRNGVYYETGAEVVLDKGERPHPEWTEVKALAPEPEPKRGRKAKEEDDAPAKQRERLFDKDII